MKSLVTFLYFLIVISVSLSAKGIEFFTGSFAEAKIMASQQGKLIFIDAFTTWCGPCKRMSSTVFTQDEVGEFYNSTFINLKLDMEKGEGKDFQRDYRVSAFPTLLFLDPEGKVVHKVVGGMDVANFVKLGKFAASKLAPSSTLDKEYEEGRRDPSFMAQYIEALANGNRLTLKIVNDYLSTQKDFKTPENLKVIYHGLAEVDSRVFNLFVENRKDIVKLIGNEAVEKKISKAAEATVKKAIEFDSPDLLEEAIEKVKRYAESQSKPFQHTARLDFYRETRRPDMYLKMAKEYIRLGDQYKVDLVNEILYKMKDQPTVIDQASIWAVEIADKESNEQNCFNAAQLLYITGQYQKSQLLATQALKFAKEANSGAVPHIQSLLVAIEQKSRLDKS